MDGFLEKAVAVTAAIVGAGLLHHYLVSIEQNLPQEKSEFDKLIDNQCVCDVLDGPTLIAWFKEQEANIEAPLVFFIAKLTDETAKMFALMDIPEKLDREHTLLQVAVDKESYDVKAIRLINYVTQSDGVARLLKEEDYVIVNGGSKND